MIPFTYVVVGLVLASALLPTWCILKMRSTYQWGWSYTGRLALAAFVTLAIAWILGGLGYDLVAPRILVVSVVGVLLTHAAVFYFMQKRSGWDPLRNFAHGIVVCAEFMGRFADWIDPDPQDAEERTTQAKPVAESKTPEPEAQPRFAESGFSAPTLYKSRSDSPKDWGGRPVSRYEPMPDPGEA